MKFSKMQTYLKDKQLEDDTAQAFESLYTHITMGISFVFDSSVNIIPPFHRLNKNISFRRIFLQNLIGETKDRCDSVFSKIGSLIKIFILDNNGLAFLSGTCWDLGLNLGLMSSYLKTYQCITKYTNVILSF